MGALRASVVPLASLDDGTRDRMWDLFAAYYDDVARPTFERDLDGKTTVNRTTMLPRTVASESAMTAPFQAPTHRTARNPPHRRRGIAVSRNKGDDPQGRQTTDAFSNQEVLHSAAPEGRARNPQIAPSSGKMHGPGRAHRRGEAC